MSIYVNGACASVLDTAAKRHAGEIDGFGAFGGIVVAGVMLKAVEDKLATVDPLPDQRDIRDTLQAQVDTIQGLLRRWLDKEISSADVPEFLGDTCIATNSTMEDILIRANTEGVSREAIEGMLDEIAEALEQLSEE